ncbi:MAG: cobalt-precorrin-6A reductase [Cyanobacteriota bacterium]|nr:cobalt-precorrin-6A reductase [Cyanobacteriota bacterium]
MRRLVNKRRLWLIGGTGEAVALARALAIREIPCLVTLTTAAARDSYGRRQNLEVEVGSLPVDALPAFIQAKGIGAILDASHPFAVVISQGAIAAAQNLAIPYWRYERPLVADLGSQVGLCHVSDLNSVFRADLLAGQRVLLTLGYRWLAAFQPWQSQATLFARILPSPEALTAALTAGFSPDRLIALRPPIGAELETALWRQWGITTVITKASGQAGGEQVKQRVAQILGIPLIIIDRPPVEYPLVSHSLEELLALVETWWKFQN